MRKKTGKRFAFLRGVAVPFLTVLVMVFVALFVFVRVTAVADGNDAAVYSVMLLVVIMLSLCYTVGDIVRRKLTVDKPVEAILKVTEKIAAGDFSARVETLHYYEKYNDYDLIMENINAMAAALEKSEAVNADFVSNVSHELKTPLAIIQSYAALLKKETDAEKREKYSDVVISATKRLTALVTDTLKLNKLENQEIGLDYGKVDLSATLADAVVSFEDACENKNVQLDCDFEQAEIYSERSLLDIVWNNLLSNAVKFTEPGGKITVILRKTKDGAVVSVTDTGCGIPTEAGGRIFDKFYQGDTSHSGEGNGLGLALVKRVIDLIGGKISVKSQLGKGSTFTVTLKG